MIKIKRQNIPRICQGDIFRNVEYIESADEKKGIVEISKINFPYVIVLTQDCDLEQDYKFRWSKKQTSNQDKWLLSVLVAPLYNLDQFYRGEHLSELDMNMMTIKKGKTQGNNLINNQIPRFHYIEFPEDIPIVKSIIDFKHYFSVSVSYLRKIKRLQFVCTVSHLYREDISQRFAAFLSRIGVP